MHAALGVLMGYYVGIAKFAEESSRINTLLLGLFYATFFHGSYDFVLFQNASAILSFVFVPIMIWAFFYVANACLCILKILLFENRAKFNICNVGKDTMSKLSFFIFE